jgi:hypothetical protein
LTVTVSDSNIVELARRDCVAVLVLGWHWIEANGMTQYLGSRYYWLDERGTFLNGIIPSQDLSRMGFRFRLYSRKQATAIMIEDLQLEQFRRAEQGIRSAFTRRAGPTHASHGAGKCRRAHPRRGSS